MNQDSLPGIYRAVVVSNVDKNKQHRLDLKIPAVFADEVVYGVLPCLPPIANPLLPKAGTTVWVQFENGNERMPVWTGVLRPL